MVDSKGREGHRTHQGPKHGYRGISYYFKREEKGKVNQIDIGNKRTRTII